MFCFRANGSGIIDYLFYQGRPVIIPYPAYFLVVAELKHTLYNINSVFPDIYQVWISIPKKSLSEFHVQIQHPLIIFPCKYYEWNLRIVKTIMADQIVYELLIFLHDLHRFLFTMYKQLCSESLFLNRL